MTADLPEYRVRQRFAGPVPAVGAQVVAGFLEGHIGCLEHLQRLGHDLGATPSPPITASPIWDNAMRVPYW